VRVPFPKGFDTVLDFDFRRTNMEGYARTMSWTGKKRGWNVENFWAE
jgi:hypothetical protein